MIQWSKWLTGGNSVNTTLTKPNASFKARQRNVLIGCHQWNSNSCRKIKQQQPIVFLENGHQGLRKLRVLKQQLHFHVHHHKNEFQTALHKQHGSDIVNFMRHHTATHNHVKLRFLEMHLGFINYSRASSSTFNRNFQHAQKQQLSTPFE